MELLEWYWSSDKTNNLVLRFTNDTEFRVSPENLAGILSTFPGDFQTDILDQFGKTRFERVRSITQPDKE